MKRLVLFLTVILLIMTVSFNAFAAGTLSAKSVSAEKGDVFSVEIKLSENPGIIATRIMVDYDSRYLSLKGAKNGDVFPQSKALFGKDYSQLPYSMIWDDALGTNITANGTLAVLEFEVKAENSSGKTDIRITVDKGSTFDEELKEKSISGTVCTVKFPVAETTEKQTVAKDTTTKKAEQTTEKTATVTSTSKVTTTKKNNDITSPKAPTASSVTEEILGTKDRVTSKVTEKAAASEKLTEKEIAVVDKTETVSEPFVSDSGSEIFDKTEETVAAAEIITEEDVLLQEEGGNLKYLWLLTLIPVAAVVIIIVKRKADVENA